MSTLSPSVETALERFRALLKPAEFKRLVEVLSQDLPPAIRINLLKQDPSAFIRQLQERYGWHFKPVPFCPSGFELSGQPENLGKTIEHALGEYYIQESASMLPVEMFDLPAEPAPLILDMAASPGGKTTHLVDRTHDHALVIANDASSGRIAALRVVLAKWGATNQAITCLHGDYFGAHLPERFDAVLLDAPCSMQNLYDSPSHPLREVSAGEQQSLSNRQFLLLRSALQTVKVGGQVVYSTCTLSPQEDEQVVQRVLDEFDVAVQLDDLSPRLPHPAPALLGDGTNTFSPAMKNAVRLWPHSFGTTGFFTARFSKLDVLPDNRDEYAVSTNQRLDCKNCLSEKEINLICAWMKDFYDFDLQASLEAQHLTIMDSGNALLLVPLRLLQDFSDLPLTSFGLNAFKRIPNGYQISHELAARFGQRFQSGIVVLDQQQSRTYLAHQDIFHTQSNSSTSGETILLKNEYGQVLGRAKALKDRLKNLLPPRLL